MFFSSDFVFLPNPDLFDRVIGCLIVLLIDILLVGLLLWLIIIVITKQHLAVVQAQPFTTVGCCLLTSWLSESLPCEIWYHKSPSFGIAIFCSDHKQKNIASNFVFVRARVRVRVSTNKHAD